MSKQNVFHAAKYKLLVQYQWRRWLAFDTLTMQMQVSAEISVSCHCNQWWSQLRFFNYSYNYIAMEMIN